MIVDVNNASQGVNDFSFIRCCSSGKGVFCIFSKIKRYFIWINVLLDKYLVSQFFVLFHAKLDLFCIVNHLWMGYGCEVNIPYQLFNELFFSHIRFRTVWISSSGAVVVDVIFWLSEFTFSIFIFCYEYGSTASTDSKVFKCKCFAAPFGFLKRYY